VEAGLICIFIEPRILNEARVSSYIQDILSREEFFFKEKMFKICNFGDHWVEAGLICIFIEP